MLNSFPSLLLCTIALSLLCHGCRTTSQAPPSLTSQDSTRILKEILIHRSEADSYFRYDRNSPFQEDSSAHYDSIKWFEPDLKYYFRSRLYRYEHPDTVSIFGTKGEERKELRYGYFSLPYEERTYKLNVYKFTPYERAYYSHRNLLSVWFTDETSGKETYGVGRYLDVGNEQPGAEHLYVIDFNKAYNPYCAYSPTYSCAIPSKEDHLDFPVLAGEKKYHR